MILSNPIKWPPGRNSVNRQFAMALSRIVMEHARLSLFVLGCLLSAVAAPGQPADLRTMPENVWAVPDSEILAFWEAALTRVGGSTGECGVAVAVRPSGGAHDDSSVAGRDARPSDAGRRATGLPK
jgi:hypothetical protein